MKHIKISIIGGGHMGRALAKGMLRSSTTKGVDITISTPHQEKLNEFSNQTHCWITSNNQEAVKSADIIFIAVKPTMVADVIAEMKSSVSENALIVSVAAAVSLKLLAKYFDSNRKLVRIMPNIPVALGLGVIGWIGKNITMEDEQVIKNILSPLGLVIGCKSEDQLDRLSLLSGCGPGIISYIINIFETIAATYGFNSKQASSLVLATIEGTVNHMKITNVSSQKLVAEVATKGGITEEIIKSLQNKKTQQIFSASLQRGYDKIKHLSFSLRTQRKP